MDKKSKYARNGALILGIGNALLNTINQLNEMEEDPNREFDWRRMLGAALKGAAVGGIGGFAVGALVDHQNSLEEPINTDEFLLSVVDSVRLDKNDSYYRSLDEKADRLISLLKENLGDKLAGEPMRLGSTEHGTALANNFDIDICLPFKPDSFSSTAQMYDYLDSFLEQMVGKQSIIKTRNQRKSIGIMLKLKGVERRIDIVPYKLTASNKNKTSGYLFINDPYSPSYSKTDIHALLNLKLTETQKKIVVVLKHWKAKNELPMSSHLLQNFVIDAYQRNHVPRAFTDKILMVLRHIRDNIDVAVIRSVENTNNILTNISDSKKAEIIRACKRAIEDFEYQPNSVVEIFEVE